MATRAFHRVAACIATCAAVGLLTIAAPPVFAAPDDDEPGVVWCDDDEDECRRMVIDVDGNPNVFYFNEPGEDFKFRVQAPQLAYSFGGGAYLGINLVNLTSELREHFGAPAKSGVMISRVEDDTPAFQAGLRVGDVITAIDGEPVQSASAMSGLIRKRDEGDEVVLELFRNGRPLELRPVLAERPRPAFDVGSWVHFDDEHDGKHGPRSMVLDIDPEALKESIERFRTTWDDEAMQERLHRFRTMESSLEDKINALEGRIRELERELDDGD